MCYVCVCVLETQNLTCVNMCVTCVHNFLNMCVRVVYFWKKYGKFGLFVVFYTCFNTVLSPIFHFWCAIIVLELVVGNETIYKLKNGKELDPRGKNKSLVFYKFWSNKKSKRNTKRTKSCVEVMYFTCVYMCVTCVHM